MKHTLLLLALLTLFGGAALAQTPPTAPVPDPKLSAPVPKPGWVLTFDDEFNGTTLDTSKWTAYDHASDINGEQQYYAPNDVTVQDGFVRLKSEKRSYGGRDYTSGEIRTRDKFGQKYGFFEFRARLARTAGTWSAEYLITESEVWPPEVDVEEYLGREPGWVHLTNHYLTLDGVHESSHSQTDTPDDWTQWHTYAVDWEPNRVTWFVDGTQRGQSPDDGTVSHIPMYVRINTALGGWGGDLTGGQWPQFHDVDWVRVWRKNSQPPPVNAGADLEATLPQGKVTLNGTSCSPMGLARALWSVVNGPGPVTFADPHALDTAATFTKSGTYTLRLSVHDGNVGASDTMRVVVNPAHVTQLTATADAYSIVNSLDPALHASGGETTLQVGGRPANGGDNNSRDRVKAYLTFDMAGVKSVGRAVLRLYGGLRYDGGTTPLPCAVYGVRDVTWDEKQGDWKTSPALGPQVASFSVIPTVHHGTERGQDIDVTDYVRARLAAGASKIGFAVVPQDTAGALWAFFHSREADTGKPRLIITPTTAISLRRSR